jgi:periplasmic protein TonB
MSSFCPSALASLDDSLVLFCESLGELKAAKSVDIAEVIEQFKLAAESARNLRVLVSAELPEASWENRQELDVLLEKIQKRVEARNLEQLRGRLLALATELERGSIVHRRALRVKELNQFREQAISELRSQAGSEGAPQTLPGPAADEWIEWACGLQDPEDAESLQALRNGFAHLDDFVANLEPDMWMVKTVPETSLQGGEDLQGLIADVREQLRSRLLDLATELERGKIAHHRAFRLNQLNQLRDQAINELRTQAELEGAPTLPGPEAGQWIEWACGLKEPEDAEPLQTLRNGFAHLDDFVANLEPDMWIAAAGSPTLEIPAEPDRSVDDTNQEPPRPASEGSDEPQIPRSLDEPSLSALESDTLTSSYVTPPPTGEEEEVQRMPAQKRALLATTIALVADRVRHFSDPVHPPFTDFRETSTETPITSDLRTRLEQLWRYKRRMLLATVAVLMLAVLGAILWRSHRSHTSNGPAKVIEGVAPGVIQVNPENKGFEQSGMSVDSSSKQQTEKQSKAKDQSVVSKPLPTALPEKQASKLDDGVLRPPLTVPKNVATVKKEEADPKGATEAPNSVPIGLPGGVPSSVTNIVRDIPAAAPKLAAQKVRVSSGVAQGLLAHQVAPLYPSQARQEHIQGIVVLQAVIGKDGTVQEVHPLSGHPMLTQAAVDAVKRWRYKPYYLNGEPTEAVTQINVNFTLQGR